MNKIALFGPSHIVRYIHALDNKIIPPTKNQISYIYGFGGIPIWHKTLLNKIKSALEENKVDECYILAGDFRFGNDIFSYSDSDWNGNFTGIKKKNINVNNDKTLYIHCRETYKKLIDTYKERIKIIPWDLAIREFQNREKKSYFIEGKYKHPTWNLEEFSREFPRNIVDISFLLTNKNTNKLFIDSSAHPSLLGYLLINKILDSEKIDFDSMSESFTKKIESYLSFLHSESLIITGTSVFFRWIKLMMEKKIIQLPDNWIISEANIALANESDTKKIHFNGFSYQGENNQSWIKAILRQKNFIKCQKDTLSIVFWEMWIKELTFYRKLYFMPPVENANLKYIKKQLNDFNLIKLPDSCSTYLEINDSFTPNLLGFYHAIAVALGVDDNKTIESEYLKLFTI